MVITGGANSPYVEANIGFEGNGLAQVTGGVLGVLNRGIAFSDDLSVVNLPGDGGAAAMRVGRGTDGDGSLTVMGGGRVFVSGSTDAEMQIGAGGGSQGLVRLIASELDVYGNGGMALLEIGAWDGGLGALEMTAGSSADVIGDTDAFVNVGRGVGNVGDLLLGQGSNLRIEGENGSTSFEVGTDGGAGSVGIQSGATIRLDGDDSLTVIGAGDSGYGVVTVSGIGSALRVNGAGTDEAPEGTIEIAASGTGAFGMLEIIGAGSTASASEVVIGGGGTGVLLLRDNSWIAADTVHVNSGGVLAGSGTVQGDVFIDGGSLGVGDTWNAAAGASGGGAGIGSMVIEGDLVQTGGQAFFDVGPVNMGDFLDLTGSLSFTNTQIHINHDGETPVEGTQFLLAVAGTDVSLSGISLAGNLGALGTLQTHEDAPNELWFVVTGDVTPPPPPTGQALSMVELGREGATITYGISVDPELVTDGVLDDLTFRLDFDTDLISYVDGSITPGFDAVTGSLTISGSDLTFDTFGAPVLTFDMALTERPGARDISFAISDVFVNGVEMEDQIGGDAPSFSYAPAFFAFSGAVDIRQTLANPIDQGGTELRFTTDAGTVTTTTDSDGNFDFGLLAAGTSGTLEIVRDYNPLSAGGTDKALGIQDVLSLFRVVVEATSGTPETDDFIAADFNGDGAVNIQDVLGLFRHVVDAQPAPEPAYLFVDQADMPAATLADVPALPDSFDIGPINADTSFSFLGILTGDLQGHV